MICMHICSASVVCVRAVECSHPCPRGGSLAPNHRRYQSDVRKKICWAQSNKLFHIFIPKAFKEHGSCQYHHVTNMHRIRNSLRKNTGNFIVSDLVSPVGSNVLPNVFSHTFVNVWVFGMAQRCGCNIRTRNKRSQMEMKKEMGCGHLRWKQRNVFGRNEKENTTDSANAPWTKEKHTHCGPCSVCMKCNAMLIISHINYHTHTHVLFLQMCKKLQTKMCRKLKR